ILIGHSFGGFIVQYFTKKNPQKISGVVLVESSHPDQIDRLTKFNLINKNENREIITGREPLYSGIPKDALSHWDMLNSRRKAFFTQMEENSYFQESAEQIKNAGKFPDVPLAVITRDQELLPVTENGHSMENEWRKMQRELVQLSKHGWQTIAKNSGHSIHIDAPNVVIEEVLKIRDKINELSSYSGTNNN
ncbi:MAG: hypothetical protein GTO02_07615, partial [Candidatus Dadabacteria bacterium]|nr:hypothetical protein [Candidatus Dadabacteria bacterium]